MGPGIPEQGTGAASPLPVERKALRLSAEPSLCARPRSVSGVYGSHFHFSLAEADSEEHRTCSVSKRKPGDSGQAGWLHRALVAVSRGDG